MKRRTAAIVIALMVTISVLMVGIGIVMADTRYSFLEQVPEGTSQTQLILHDLNDCNLTITFIDEPNLLYKMDIEYYEPTPIWSAYPYHEITVDSLVASAVIHPNQRVKSLNITIGPTIYYLHFVRCYDVNTTIVYDDNVELNQTLYYYEQGFGSLSVTVTEDIRNGIGALIVCDTVMLDITVPVGFSGGVKFYSGSINVERTGWAYNVDTAYGTYDGFYDNSTYNIVYADLWFQVECDELYLKLMS